MNSKSAAIRTLVQAAIGLVAGGFVTEAWNVIIQNHQLHPTLQGLVSLLIVYVVTTVQNEREAAGVEYPIVTALRDTKSKDTTSQGSD